MKMTAMRWSGMIALGTAASLCAPAAWAQQEVARLKQLNGSVLVSGQTGLATGTEAQQLANGVRVITTANSRVIVAFRNGCEVKMEENQRLDVESDKPCAALVPQALGAVAATAPGVYALIVPVIAGALGANEVLHAGPSAGVVIVPTPVSPN